MTDQEARYVVTLRRRGEVIPYPLDGKLRTRVQVLAIRRKWKAKGYEVFARKLVKIRRSSAPAKGARGARKVDVGAATPPAQKWTGWRNSQREAIKKRSWYCESIPACTAPGIHVHHLFGRVEEPWASSFLAGLNLCYPHHSQAHGDATFRDRLRLLGLTRMVQYLGPRIPEVKSLGPDMIRTHPPRATYEWLVSIARSAGVKPPDWKE